MKTTEGIKIILVEKMFGHFTPSIPLDETYMVPSIEKLFEPFFIIVRRIMKNYYYSMICS